MWIYCFKVSFERKIHFQAFSSAPSLSSYNWKMIGYEGFKWPTKFSLRLAAPLEWNYSIWNQCYENYATILGQFVEIQFAHISNQRIKYLSQSWCQIINVFSNQWIVDRRTINVTFFLVFRIPFLIFCFCFYCDIFSSSDNVSIAISKEEMKKDSIT